MRASPAAVGGASGMTAKGSSFASPEVVARDVDDALPQPATAQMNMAAPAR
jgi:hypothetical protein